MSLFHRKYEKLVNDLLDCLEDRDLCVFVYNLRICYGNVSLKVSWIILYFRLLKIFLTSLSARVSGPGSLSTWPQTCCLSCWEKITHCPLTLSSTSPKALYTTPSAYARSAAVCVCLCKCKCEGEADLKIKFLLRHIVTGFPDHYHWWNTYWHSFWSHSDFCV